MTEWIYLDNHATTRLDDRVLAAMHPYLTDAYYNSGSLSHAAGRQIADDVAAALTSIAGELNCDTDDVIFTSGATEAANLAIFGVCQHSRQRRRKIVAVQTEHRAVLDPLERLAESGFELAWLPIYPSGHKLAGLVDLDAANSIIDDQTALVCAMLVNNEIGVIQPVAELAKQCRRVGAISFCDATAGVGRLAVDVQSLGVDLLGFSAHKFYGPKGCGGLYVRGENRSLRLRAQIVGGGQQHNLRSGTLNVPGIIGMASALCIAAAERETERARLSRLQHAFHDRLNERLGDCITLNGPSLDSVSQPDRFRVSENLNYQWTNVEGQSLMLTVPEICFSSGSACSSAQQSVSHVLTSIGLSVDQARCSTRFGLGRCTTEAEIEQAVELLTSGYTQLRRML